MEKKRYVLTDKAGPFLFGKRIRDREAILHLTESQAKYELLAGTIAPMTVAPPERKGKAKD